MERDSDCVNAIPTFNKLCYSKALHGSILGKNGVINNLLMMFGLIHEPMSLLYTDFSIIIGSVYLFLPTMIMTLVGVLENIDDDLLEAAATLGLSPLKASSRLFCHYRFRG